MNASAGQPRFAQLDFVGPDAAAFLQGYVTADLEALRVDVAEPMAVCNLKGRVVTSGWAAGTASHVRVLVPREATPAFAAHLGKYLLFSKSSLETATGGVAFHAAASPPPEGAVRLPPTDWHCTFDAAAAPNSGHGAFEGACAAARFVAVAPPIDGAFLPQMLGLAEAGAVSFSKGCYLGQEIVARAEHRGEVKQRLRAYRATGPAPPVGAEVVAGERKIGVVAAVGDALALAVTRSAADAATAAGARLELLADGAD